MPKRQFQFSPSVQLILTNLPTIRPILKVIEEGTVRMEVKQFLKHLENHLREEISEIKIWGSDIYRESLYMFSGKDWQVVSDDNIAVTVSMDQCIEPSMFNDEDDPFVGLYVPSQWKHIQGFTSGLKRFRMPGFEHIGDRSDSEDLDESCPLWSTVHLTPLVKQRKLDLNGLEKGIVDRVRRLVTREGKISGLISELRKRGRS